MHAYVCRSGTIKQIGAYDVVVVVAAAAAVVVVVVAVVQWRLEACMATVAALW